MLISTCICDMIHHSKLNLNILPRHSFCFQPACISASLSVYIEAFQTPILASGPDRNSFNLGCRRNFREIFGDNWRLWFLPIFTRYVTCVTFRCCIFIVDDQFHYATDIHRPNHTVIFCNLYSNIKYSSVESLHLNVLCQ